MLLFNKQIARPNYSPAGGEASSNENAKVLPRNTEAKADGQTPDTSRPDDYSREENRATLLHRDAQQAIQELRGVNLNKEADALQRSVDLAQNNEALDTPHTNKEAVAKNVKGQVDRALSDPLVRAAERASLYNTQAKEAIASLRAQGRTDEAASLERSVKMAQENDATSAPYANKLAVARGVKAQVNKALAGAMVGVAQMDTVQGSRPVVESQARAPSAKPGEMVSVSNANVPPEIRRQVMARVNDETPVGAKVEITVNNTKWVATKVNDRRYDYSKQST